MCQSVFDHGRMVAFHANLRTGEGANGGASHKQGVDLPGARAWLEVLGADLDWHGALSADVIVSDTGPLFIDINPRLVEPAHAWQSGVDLVGSLLDVASGTPSARPDGPASGPTNSWWPSSARPSGARDGAASPPSSWGRGGGRVPTPAVSRSSPRPTAIPWP
jgi:hypothetical protein